MSESGNGKKRSKRAETVIDSGSSYQLVRLSLDGVIVVVLFPYQRTTKNHRHRQLLLSRKVIFSRGYILRSNGERRETKSLSLRNHKDCKYVAL